MKIVREQAAKRAHAPDRPRSIHSEQSPASPSSKGHTPSTRSISEPGPDGPDLFSENEFRKHVDIFYEHLGSFLACINKADLLQSLAQGKASEALKLSISALAECIKPSYTTVDGAELCSQRAKSLVVPHLSLPSLDTTYTLLLLAYCEFARDKDSGLWMWSGLAFRMATDLGLHKSTGMSMREEPNAWNDSESGFRHRIFWCCYHLDRLISSGTGRVATILDSEIEIELPPTVAINLGEHQFPSGESLWEPFHYLTRILILLGKISDAFNRSRARDPSTKERHADILQDFRVRLIFQYTANMCLCKRMTSLFFLKQILLTDSAP